MSRLLFYMNHFPTCRLGHTTAALCSPLSQSRWERTTERKSAAAEWSVISSLGRKWAPCEQTRSQPGWKSVGVGWLSSPARKLTKTGTVKDETGAGSRTATARLLMIFTHTTPLTRQTTGDCREVNRLKFEPIQWFLSSRNNSDPATVRPKSENQVENQVKGENLDIPT